jgi:hypothetical protein
LFFFLLLFLRLRLLVYHRIVIVKFGSLNTKLGFLLLLGVRALLGQYRRSWRRRRDVLGGLFDIFIVFILRFSSGLSIIKRLNIN